MELQNYNTRNTHNYLNADCNHLTSALYLPSPLPLSLFERATPITVADLMDGALKLTA